MAENELIVAEKLNPLDLFTGPAMDPLVEEIRKRVLQHVPDVSTAAGRKAVGSLAFKVASSKVILDNLGKDLVSNWKEKAKKVDAVRKKMRDDLDALRDEVRKPLTDWEEAEAVKERQAELDAQYDRDWDEAHRMHDLFERERIVRQKEAELARQEAERKAREEAERREIERKEREERIAREAEERTQKAAAEAAERARLEAEAAIQREKDRAERAEREKREAAERAKAEQEAAVRRAEERAREAAEQKERERLAAEKAERERQARLAANKKHREKIIGEIIMDVLGVAQDEGMKLDANAVSSLISHVNSGRIRHVTINY
jgi:DNA segregation ATPase FtsK/SpoIIIE-like protein